MALGPYMPRIQSDAELAATRRMLESFGGRFDGPSIPRQIIPEPGPVYAPGPMTIERPQVQPDYQRLTEPGTQQPVLRRLGDLAQGPPSWAPAYGFRGTRPDMAPGPMADYRSMLFQRFGTPYGGYGELRPFGVGMLGNLGSLAGGVTDQTRALTGTGY